MTGAHKEEVRTAQPTELARSYESPRGSHLTGEISPPSLHSISPHSIPFPTNKFPLALTDVKLEAQPFLYTHTVLSQPRLTRLQIILRVRKSVRSIVDLDPKHQGQGTSSSPRPSIYTAPFTLAMLTLLHSDCRVQP